MANTDIDTDSSDTWEDAPRSNVRSLAAWLVGINIAVFIAEILIRKRLEGFLAAQAGL